MRRILNALLRPTRRWRMARNLAFAALVVCAGVFLAEWTPLTRYGAYRKALEQYLLSPSELILKVENYHTSAYLNQGEGWAAVGKTTLVAVNGSLVQEKYAAVTQLVPLEGTVVLALPELTEGHYGVDSNPAMVIAVTGVPEGTKSGLMKLEIEDEQFSARAEMEENGWMFFYLYAHPYDSEHGCALWRAGVRMFLYGMDEYPYALQVFDRAGDALEGISGSLPPNMRLFAP